MTYREHIYKTFRLAYPVCLGQLGHIMVGVVDTAFVGSIGTPELAAVSLANSFYMLLLVFGIGISFGITPLVASADARQDKREAGGLLKNALLLNTITGTSLFLILLIASPLLRYLNQPPEVARLAIPYLNVLMFSMVPLLVYQSFKQFAEGLSQTRMAMHISLFSNLLNVLLNYILIFGKWGFPEMGIMGACWATFISRLAMAGLMFLHIFYGTRYRAYIPEFFSSTISSRSIKSLANIGVPSGMQFLFEVGSFSLAAVMTGWIGAKELAAHQIAISIASVTYMVAGGISAAAAVRVGNYSGLGDLPGLRKSGFSAFLIAVMFMGLSAVLLLLFRNILPAFFNNDPDVTSIASSLLLITAFFQISDGVQVTGLGILRGMNDTRIPTVITLVSYWLFALPVCYLLAFRFNYGISGIWLGLLAGLTCAALLLYSRFYFISQKKLFV